MLRKLAAVAVTTLLAIVLLGLAPGAYGQGAGDARVNVGSPSAPFSQNKQNEPAIAIDAAHPNVLASGANDEIDMEACNAGTDNTCPFTPGVGVSGVYFSFDSGHSWTQPSYTGWSARNCQGVPGDTDQPCQPDVGPIGTLPKYYENGLVSDGDPAVAFGPAPGPNGFSWSNGSRLYYANLTSNFATGTFRGFEGIAVSRTDNVESAAAGNAEAWKDPVVISRQSSTTFSDKEQVWADNAESSPFFGTAYVCWASFRGQEKGNAAPAPLMVASSRDGGDTWTLKQMSGAANNGENNPPDGCTVRTDSLGRAYVFGVGTSAPNGHQAFEVMATSDDAGQTWSRARPVSGPVTQPGLPDPAQGRPTIDGVAGARSDLAPAPSVDIANGAPTGNDATNRIVMSYVSGTVAAPHVFFTESADRGRTWSARRPVETAGDRGLFSAPAISPDGSTVYVVYNAFTTPYRTTTAEPRQLVGVVRSATVTGDSTGAFTTLHRGAPGDPRGSSANSLTDEFLGDYVYAAATRGYGAAVWNDARDAADCPAIDAYRQAIVDGRAATAPAVQQECPANFGNSDIYSFTSAP
jgi:hypothetical protein